MRSITTIIHINARYAILEAISNEEGKKGRIAVSQLADLAVLSSDYFTVPGDEIQDITSVLTMLGGKVVYGDGEFGTLSPDIPPAMPDWSPVRTYGGYQARRQGNQSAAALSVACGCAHRCGVHGHAHAAAWAAEVPVADVRQFWGALGCSCWAF